MNQATRQKIEDEIAAGKLGIARDRLHGLVLSYPEDASLRSRLGDVYWKLGYPVEAGRFWFLDSPLDGEKQAAVDLFIKSCHSDPAEILRRLRLRTDVPGLGAEARVRLDELLSGANARLPSAPRPAQNGTDTWSTFGCLAFMLLFLSLAIIGLATVVAWLRNLV